MSGFNEAMRLTSLSSASFPGLGQVPGSSVMARKKLYAQRRNMMANMRCVNAYPGVSDITVSDDAPEDSNWSVHLELVA